MGRQLKYGFSALELITAMAIVAILLSTAVPAFKNYGWNLRMKTVMDLLQTDLNLARSRAISMNTPTVICPATEGLLCTANGIWQHGWIVFTDINGDRQRQAEETILKQTTAIELVDVSGPQSRSTLRFYPNGSAPGSNATILFCDQRGAEYAGTITLSSSGRIRLQSNGVKPRSNCL
jgi:type IV fimbrial biogenesis protein FimT